jgi:hypothetical protein
VEVVVGLVVIENLQVTQVLIQQVL